MPPKGYRKRKDPDDAPIDGDRTADVVLNKDPAFKYALVHQEDMPRMVGRGYVREFSGPDSAKPAYGLETVEGAEQVVNGQLVLMKIPKDRGEAIQKRSEQEFASRTAGLTRQINDHINEHGGNFRRAAG